MPATIVDRDQVVAGLIAQWAAVESVAEDLSDDEWTSPSVLPGWSVADVVAHVIGTESMLDGREVDAIRDVAMLDHVRNPIGELNERWLDHYRGATRADVMTDYREIVAVRTAALQAMTQADFDAEALTPAGRDTYGRFMRIRIFDCWVHEVDLLDSAAGPDPMGRRVPDNPVTQGWALDEIGASLPFVIGKRAGAPTGARVMVNIAGLAPRTLRIDVGERARAVDAFDGGDGTATVTLTVDGVELARLVGGRPGGEPSLVRIEGDHALGRQIVASLNYLI